MTSEYRNRQSVYEKLFACINRCNIGGSVRMESFRFRLGAFGGRWKTVCFGFPSALLLGWLVFFLLVKLYTLPSAISETNTPDMFRAIVQAEDGRYHLVAIAYRSPSLMETAEEDRQAIEKSLGHKVLWEPSGSYNFIIGPEEMSRAESQALAEYREPNFYERALRFMSLTCCDDNDGENEYLLWVRTGRFEFTYVYSGGPSDAELLKYADFTPNEMLQAFTLGVSVVVAGTILVWLLPMFGRRRRGHRG